MDHTAPMTALISGTSAKDALRMMRATGLSALPLIDVAGVPRGLVSAAQCEHRIAEGGNPLLLANDNYDDAE